MICSHCQSDATGAVQYSARLLLCPVCGALFPVPKTKKTFAKDATRRRSSRQEKHNAVAVGGRITANSGAGSDKGDVKIPGILREEDKTTLKKSYSLKLVDLQKVAAAAQLDEIPVMRISFGDDLTKQFVVVPGEWFNYLLELYKKEQQ